MTPFEPPDWLITLLTEETSLLPNKISPKFLYYIGYVTVFVLLVEISFFAACFVYFTESTF